MGRRGAWVVARACCIIGLILVKSNTLVVSDDDNTVVWSVSLYIVALCGIIINISVILYDTSVCIQKYWTRRQVVWSVHGMKVVLTVIVQSVLRMGIFMNIQRTESFVSYNILLLRVDWSHTSFIPQVGRFLFFDYSSNVFRVSFRRFTGRLRSHGWLTELLPRVTMGDSQSGSISGGVSLWYLTASPASAWAASTLVKNRLKVHPVSVVSANF